MKKVQFAIIGAILGLPLSYYFQSDYVKSKVGGMGGYLKNFGDVVSNSDLVGNVILSVVIFALVGGVIGYFVDENDAKNTKMLNTSESTQNAERQTNFCPSCGGKIEDGETQFCESCGTKF